MANKTNEIDYTEYPIPDEHADREKFTCTQRRAELARLALAAGTLDVIEPTRLFERYGLKNHSQISHDKKAIIPTLKKHYKIERILADVLLAKRWSLRGAIKNGDYKTANQIADTILEMAFNLGIVEKAADKVDVNFLKEYETWFKPKPVLIRDEDLK